MTPAAPEIRYIGFWARVIATVVDTVALGLLLIPLAWMLGLDGAELKLAAGFGSDAPEVPALPVLGADTWLQWALYAALVIGFWAARSATPGKMAIGAVIVDAKTLGEPNFGQWLIRYLGYFLSTVVLMLGFIWVAFDERKQGWHDKLAGTLVIRKPG